MFHNMILTSARQGAASGSLSVSRVIEPMQVLHSRLYWNVEARAWAIKTRRSAGASATASITSPRWNPLESAESLLEAAQRAKDLRRSAELIESLDLNSLSSAAKVQDTLRHFLKGLKEHDNVLGVPPDTPGPLTDWVKKHSKALGLKCACPGSPFAPILSNTPPN